MQPDAMKNLLCFELGAFYNEFFRSVYDLRFFARLFQLYINNNQSIFICAPGKKYHFYSSILMSNQANHNKIVLKWNKKIGEISSGSCNKRKSICFLVQNQG